MGARSIWRRRERETVWFVPALAQRDRWQAQRRNRKEEIRIGRKKARKEEIDAEKR